MSYRNKTYVIFDGDEDMWAYGFMKGWKQNEHIDFDFFDAHDLRPLTQSASEETVRRRLRERLSNTKQAVVLVGEKTKNLYRFVRWEIETCLNLQIPIVVANLNGLRYQDSELCPPVLRDECAVHVSFKMKIIKHALDDFPPDYGKYLLRGSGAMRYPDSVYAKLGL